MRLTPVKNTPNPITGIRNATGIRRIGGRVDGIKSASGHYVDIGVASYSRAGARRLEYVAITWGMCATADDVRKSGHDAWICIGTCTDDARMIQRANFERILDAKAVANG